MALQLETNRLILRNWHESDLEPWIEMCADEDVMRYFPSTLSPAEARERARVYSERLERNGYGLWIAEIKGGARFAGIIGVHDVSFEAAFTPAIEAGWRLAHEHWGNGYAVEGARAVIAYAFEHLYRSEVVAMTSAFNIPSQRVMQKLGMTHDPRDDFEHPNIAPGHRLRKHVLYRIAATS